MKKATLIQAAVIFAMACLCGCRNVNPPILSAAPTLTPTMITSAEKTQTEVAAATMTATIAVPPYKTSWSFPLSNGPEGIAVDNANSRIYATQWYTGGVVGFNMTGTVQAQWSANGSGDGQLNFVAGLVVDGAGNIYVCDDGNNRVQKFTPAGAYLLQFGGSGSADGKFSGGPIGIGIDSNGDLFATDQSNCRVQKFSAAGAFLSKFGTCGTNDGQFEHPAGICVDAANNIYVSDIVGRVQKFNAQGQLVMKFGGYGTEKGQLYNPQGLAVAPNGYIYVADSGNNRISIFNSNGQYVTQWGNSFGYPGTGPGEFNSPQDLDFDASGNLYVADHGNNRIQIFGY